MDPASLPEDELVRLDPIPKIEPKGRLPMTMKSKMINPVQGKTPEEFNLYCRDTDINQPSSVSLHFQNFRGLMTLTRARNQSQT